MKKLFCFVLIGVMLLTLASCGDSKEEPKPTASTEGIDIDLTVLNSNLAYSELYNIIVNSENYIGQTVKMKGLFSYYKDPQTNNEYFGCVVADAAACCSIGLEFVLEGLYSYPKDYPNPNSEITVTGTFETYDENGKEYCRLAKAKMVS